MNDEIKPGTMVTVFFGGDGDLRLGPVEFVRGPRGDGDAFVIRLNDGRICYVKNFEMMQPDEIKEQES